MIQTRLNQWAWNWMELSIHSYVKKIFITSHWKHWQDSTSDECWIWHVARLCLYWGTSQHRYGMWTNKKSNGSSVAAWKHPSSPVLDTAVAAVEAIGAILFAIFRPCHSKIFELCDAWPYGCNGNWEIIIPKVICFNKFFLCKASNYFWYHAPTRGDSSQITL